ncbi:hypothetical protein BH23CHL5_BH23CHL5_18220 [soil metagenome]
MLRGLLNQSLNELEVDVAGMLKKRADPAVQIVDCREPDEWDGGHLDGSVLIPLGSLADRKGELDSKRPVVVVCRSGQRSLVAAELLSNSGFSDAMSLSGGLIAWVNEGHDLEL